MPSYHAPFGGSTAGRWKGCTGSPALIATCPRPPTNAAAMAGTACHTIMERLLRDPDLFPDQFLNATVDGVQITPQHVEYMKAALDAVDDILATFPEDAPMMAERFLIFDIGDGSEDEPEAGGSCDLIVVSGTRAAVCDFKFGQIMVEASSTQNLFYMCAAVRALPDLFANVEKFESYIIQPAYDPALMQHNYTRAEIETATMEFDTAIYMAKNGAPKFIEGEHCAYCPAAIACPAKTQRLETLFAADRPQDIQAMAAFWISFQEVWDTANAIRTQLQHELEHGVTVPGLKLVARRTEDQWRNENEAFATLRNTGLSTSQIMRLRPPSELATMTTAAVLAPLVHRPPGGNTIAPASDRRPAVLPVGALGAALARLQR